MSRGIGEVELIQELIPEWLAVFIALLTQLGDIWFLALLLTVLYWMHSEIQDEVAVVAGVWLAGMGLYKGLKELFALPRPEQPLLDAELLPWVIRPLYDATAFATGYGFPSGHAVNTTIVYFGLAYVLAAGTRRQRVGVAAAIVATVSFTRIALGVHYLIDVVVGFAVGGSLLLGAWTLMRRIPADRPTVAFGLAVIFAGFFVLTSEVHPDALFVLAASLGAFAGWQVIMLGRQLVLLNRPSHALRPIAIRGGAAAMAVAPLVAVLEFFPRFSAYAAGGTIGLAAAGLVMVPVMRHSERVQRVSVALVFWIKMAGVGIRSLLEPQTWKRILAVGWNYLARIRNRLEPRNRD